MSKIRQHARISQTRHQTRHAVAPKQQQKLIALYQARQWDKAEALAREMTNKHPSDPFAWKSLGSVLLESGQRHSSLDALEKALTLAPDDPELYNTMAQAMYRLGAGQRGYRPP